jgi:3',5'-cyclic AMP phosphodiesterase CpdA
MLHHPPVAGVVSRRKSLEDGTDLRQRLETHGVDLVLHGHAHEAAVSTLRGPQGAIPVLGVPSASAAGYGRHPSARWHAIEIMPSMSGASIRITARGLSRDTGAFEDLGSYALAPPQRG